MATYYIATDGNDLNLGTIGNPWKSWQKGFSSLTAGDTLYIRGGTYTDMRGHGDGGYYGVEIGVPAGAGTSGTSGSHITVSAYPGEVPILDGSSLTMVDHSIIGIRLNNCNYWDLIGLTVINFLQHSYNVYDAAGVYQWSCDYITYNRCTVHDCGQGFEVRSGSARTDYTNCDSYQNWDNYSADSPPDPGGLSNGFHAMISAGQIVNYTGCRAWSNSDDGWDMYGSSGYVTIRNCWSFENADGYGGQNGDGAGFKLGPVSTDETGNQRVCYNCVAFGNLGLVGNGFDANQGSTLIPMQLYNCTSYGNIKNIMFYHNAGSTVRNCISFGATGDPDEFGTNTVDHNSWQDGLSAATADFKSIVTSLAKGARQSNGNLPIIDLLHLTTGSDLIGVASTTDMYATDGDGHAWATPPSIGAFEYGETENIPVTAVTVTGAGNATTITVDNGTLQMSAHIDPHDATDQTVVWSVVNGTGRASINQSGLLTAIDNGTVIVKATSNG